MWRFEFFGPHFRGVQPCTQVKLVVHKSAGEAGEEAQLWLPVFTYCIGFKEYQCDGPIRLVQLKYTYDIGTCYAGVVVHGPNGHPRHNVGSRYHTLEPSVFFLRGHGHAGKASALSLNHFDYFACFSIPWKQ